MDEHAINHLLWRTDPMGTGCALDDGMEDEYQHQASNIAQRLAQGQDPHSAVTAVFEASFWEGCLSEGQRKASLEAIVAALEKEDSKGQPAPG